MSRFPDPLAARARSTPDRIGLVDAATGETRRYDELDASATDLAGHLAGLGLEPGDHLGTLAGTSTDSVRLVHAAWRRGLRLVPLNVRLAEPEIERQAARADLDALACTAETADLARTVAGCPVVSLGAPGGVAGGGGGDDPGEDRLEPIVGVDPADVDPATWGRDDPALSMFTSGTTGRPKLATLTTGNLVASAVASAFRLGVHPGDRWLLCLPIYHVGGLAPVLRSALYGTALVVREGFDAGAVARETAEHDVTGLSLVPTQLERILDAEPALADSVRTVLLGGASAPESLLERCRRRDVPVHPTYGLTETASQVATATPHEAFAHPDAVGQPLLGVTVTVVDENLEPLPAGEAGEIVVSGPTVTPGYYDDSDATERAFCEHGFRTGDVGRLDQAHRLRVTGRLDDRIVSGGENVDPAAVASVLRAHPDVADAAVVGVEDPEWGERVAAIVVPDPGEVDLDADELIEHCRERLAGFEVPGTLRVADAIPRTASGTVDREALRRTLDE